VHDFVANRGEAACYDREKKASCDGVLHRERPQSTPHHQLNGENDAASSWRPAPMLCDPNALGSLSLGLTNIFASRHFDSERRPPEIGIYSADCSIWPRMLLNSFSSAARASINSGELSWLATELVRETP
jgi:hypothetical protein